MAAPEPVGELTAADTAVGESGAGGTDGRQLYLRHCAACHGENGDGRGIAADYLFPKPRDFRAGRFRLVSTSNNVPTAEDLHAVLVRGMPGSSMLSWAHLPPVDRDALVEEVMRLRREGAREQYVQMLKDEDELTDEELAEPDVQEEIEEFVTERTTPGPSTEVPTMRSADAASIARGREIYIKQSCHSCHGEDGKGGGTQVQIDDEGYSTRPRDYTQGIFKGGHDPESLYRRIAYGMPGTPMPASTQLSPDDNLDLVHFIRSLSDEPTREAAILRRETIVVRVVEKVAESVDADAWSASEPIRLRMTPLWWRDDADPDLAVQAIHDGTQIALRLTWRDATASRHAASGASFEDAVAVEVYRGSEEPFVGMGDPNSPVDVWFWDADRQGQPLAVENLYPNTVVDVFPFSETVVASAELDRDGARTADQPAISLPARASGNPIVPTADESGGTSLATGGPGTVTFRLPASQIVKAHGQWRDGRWTVVMTRPLTVPSEDRGVSLEAGGRASVAFAVWDGALGDRDGKKLITVWQDLELE